MGFLDFDGLSHFFEKVVSYTRSAYKAGDGVTINECKINVDVPVYGVYTKDSFDELPKETQNKGLYVVTDGMVNSTNLCEIPVGTVISYMGTSAPKDYLICNGAIYNIDNYPLLAQLFQEQFGIKNYFGGDGETTFAVPDMRNLFLRGYHGEAEEQLSGEIGVKQEGTEIPNVASIKDGTQSLLCMFGQDPVKNPDLIIDEDRRGLAVSNKWSDQYSYYAYTSRPVNMAVLYCIKAINSSSEIENTYSTEEIRIGTWIDGKPLYRKVLSYTISNADTSYHILMPHNSNIIVVNIDGRITKAVEGAQSLFPVPNGSINSGTLKSLLVYNNDGLAFATTDSIFVGATLYAIIEYTKTTD